MTDALDRLTEALADRYLIEREIGAGGMAKVQGASLTGSAASDRLRKFLCSNCAPNSHKLTETGLHRAGEAPAGSA